MAPGDAAREKRAVYEGRLQRTKTGLTKSQLMRNKNGKIISKAKYEAGKRLHARGKREGWLAQPFTRGGGRRGKARQNYTNQIDHAMHHGKPYPHHMTLKGMMRTPPAVNTAAAFAA